MTADIHSFMGCKKSNKQQPLFEATFKLVPANSSTAIETVELTDRSHESTARRIRAKVRDYAIQIGKPKPAPLILTDALPRKGCA